MNITISALPIALILIVIVAGIFIVSKTNRGNAAKAGYWMFGVYVIVLFLSVGVYYFIPASATEQLESAENEYNQNNLSEVLVGERPVESIHEFLVEEWEFMYEEGQIQIGYQGDLNNTVNIAVERTDGDSIKAAFYQTPVYGFNMELMEFIRPLDIQLADDRFVIKLPDTEQLEFTSFSKEFPLMQFKDSPNEEWHDAPESLYWGEQLLYLQIPRGVEINSEMDVYLEYVND
ncbi:hypothetical protein CV093_02305 [Oceanobacillus sp. 143]|uniref:Uncharacterized protein n=1 Tax=Oceanobacillus zhaokaii TaxID=2052660 RepID=A0A345PCY8_9BACI|nr:hypothetical protein [Oceanobacillus zhaokaii]AXI07868.1 hypothetical protein CUC15_02240 [Oceanobacillus zhaokaii]QGS67958.1 hypothetical protein CV093_02305 [Oceanobacillus sp. 143]